MFSTNYPRNRIRNGGISFIGIMVIVLLMAACGSTPRTFTIGVINPSPNQDVTIKGFKDGMIDLGYLEGKNITYIYEGPVSADRLEAVAQGLVQQQMRD